MTPLERAARALCRLDGHPENASLEGQEATVPPQMLTRQTSGKS